MTTPRRCTECNARTPHVPSVGDDEWVYTCTQCGLQHTEWEREHVAPGPTVTMTEEEFNQFIAGLKGLVSAS